MTGAQILVHETPASPGRSITDMRFQSGLATSRDGRLIAMQAGSLPPMGPVGGGHLYVMKRDGTGMRQIVDDASHIYNISFSPDGSKLLFEDTRGGNMDIFVINVDGSGERRLTTAPEDDQLPSWSPDGRMILYSSGHHIWVMNADGTATRRIR
jgi:Tol biopolymer transport system component